MTGIQWGKGIPEDEQVLTNRGYCLAKNITMDSILYDRNGVETRVVGIYPQGIRPCYKLIFSDERDIILDDNHLNFIIDPHNRKERLITTQQLYEKKCYWQKDRNTCQIPSISKPINLPSNNFIISPYIMGVILGDGGITSSVIISSNDQEILDRVRIELPSCLMLRHKGKYDYTIIHKTKKTTHQGYGLNIFKEELVRLNLFGKKSKDKFIPDEYSYSSVEQRIDLLRGLLDTDGWVEKNGTSKRIQFSSISSLLANGVVWLVESLGGKAWITEKTPNYSYKNIKKTGQKCFNVNIILKEINPFYLKRKAIHHFIHKRTTNKILKKIEIVEPRKTICFKVDSPTESFIIRNQIVTHNTTVGATWLRRQIHKYSTKDDNYIIAVPSYKILKQSTLPAFERIMGGLGRFYSVDSVYKIKNGPNVYIRSGTQPDSVVGITNVRGIWGDESGKYSLYFWENLQGRASFRDCPIMLTSSPYALNWIYKEIIKPKQKGLRDDITLIQARSDENPYFPKDEYNRRKLTMDARRFNMMYGGAWDKAEGLVYDCLDDDYNFIDPFDLSMDVKYYGGIDWGHTDPFVIKIRAVSPFGDQYDISEFYKTRMTVSEMMSVIKRKYETFGISMFYCDPSRPEYITELQSQGIPAIGADNSIQIGIDRHYELLKSRKLKIFRGHCPYTQDEYETYHYAEPQDLKPDQNKNDKLQEPVDQGNHCMDADRYLSISLHKNSKIYTPKVPGEIKQLTQAERIEKLKRRTANYY